MPERQVPPKERARWFQMARPSFQISPILPPSISGTASPPARRQIPSSGLLEHGVARVHRSLSGPAAVRPWYRTAPPYARKFPGPVDRSQRSEYSDGPLPIPFPPPPLSTSRGGRYQNSR